MKLPFVTALTWIIGSAVLITGGTYKGVKSYSKYKQRINFSPEYYLSRIIQTGPQKEALNTAYLAELIHISADTPTTYGRFDPRLAARQLLRCPVIKEASVEVMAPDTIYIDYMVRQPVAWLYDFTNTAIDEDGYPFPVSPFFTPKNLPEIYLATPQKLSWHKPVEGKNIELALDILKLASFFQLELKRVDVSKAFAESLGSREIVVVTTNAGFSHYLRLTPKNYAQELGNYLELRSTLPPKPQIIDLRLSQLGFIEEIKST